MRLVPLCGLCTRWIDPRFQIVFFAAVPPEKRVTKAATFLLHSPVFQLPQLLEEFVDFMHLSVRIGEQIVDVSVAQTLDKFAEVEKSILPAHM